MHNSYKTHAYLFSVGNYTYGHEYIKCYAWDSSTRVTIGKYCSFGNDITMVLGGNHRPDWFSMYPFGHVNQHEFSYEQYEGHPSTKGDIVIGNDVWVGLGATILSGVTIGNGSVIGAKAVVTKDVPPYSIFVGNPGAVAKYRFSPEIIEVLEKIAYWDLPPTIVRQISSKLSTPATIESANKLYDEIKGLIND